MLAASRDGAKLNTKGGDHIDKQNDARSTQSYDLGYKQCLSVPNGGVVTVYNNLRDDNETFDCKEFIRSYKFFHSAKQTSAD